MKLVLARGNTLLFREFPPQKCGGLIEAQLESKLAKNALKFPPQKCGGLIEA